jgi:hypothetical protein
MLVSQSSDSLSKRVKLTEKKNLDNNALDLLRIVLHIAHQPPN